MDLLGADMEEDTALPPLLEAMVHHRPVEDTARLPLVDALYVPPSLSCGASTSIAIVVSNTIVLGIRRGI